MSEWTSHKLADLINIKHGFAFKGEYFGEDPDGPIIVTPGNFAIGGGFKEGKPKSYSGEIPDGFTLSEGDLVITMTDLSKAADTLGYAGLIPGGKTYLHNQRIGRVYILKPEKVESNFLHYALRTNTYRHHVVAGATGTTVKHTSPTRICQYVLSLPPVSEQRAIAEMLGALDDKIAVNERISATSRGLALALLSQALLVDEVLEFEVDSVCSELTRGVSPGYSELPDDLVVLNQKCIRNGRVSLAPARRTVRGKVKSPKLLRRDDVLVNSTGVGTLGRVARWNSESEATVDSHITIVRFDDSVVDPVCAGFAMLRAQPEIEAMGEGSTGQTELRRTQLGGLEITLPSAVQQQHLRPKLDALEARSDQALAESEALTALRDALLPQLMSGRLRVKDAEKFVEERV